jgi:hypothetical protein
MKPEKFCLLNRYLITKRIQNNDLPFHTILNFRIIFHHFASIIRRNLSKHNFSYKEQCVGNEIDFSFLVMTRNK